MFYKKTSKPSRAHPVSISNSSPALPAWVYAKPEPEARATTPHDAAGATDGLLTRADVARYLRVCDRTVSRLIRTGRLPASRIGRAVRIRHSDLLDMLDGRPSISAVLGACRE